MLLSIAEPSVTFADRPVGDRSIPAVRVLYVAGTGRSGSTLLEEMLARSPGFVAVGEMRYLWLRGFVENHLCSCGEPFLSCPFWTAVVAAAYPGGIDPEAVLARQRRIDRIRNIPRMRFDALRGSAYRDDLERHGADLAALYRAIRDVSGAEVVIDSSKDAPYAFLLDTVEGIDVYVAHLVRDSRAVAHSWQRQRVRPEIHWQVQYMRRYSPFVSSQLWSRTNGLYELMGLGRSGYLRLHYEDMARDPEAAMRRLRDRFAPLSPAFAALTAAAAAEPAVHSVSGNPIRFDRGDRRIAVDLEWTRAMPAGDRRTVSALTLPLLARYGYLGRRRPSRIEREAP